MTIKVQKLSEMETREIEFRCPVCKIDIVKEVPVEARDGEGVCETCGTEYQWEEVDD